MSTQVFPGNTLTTNGDGSSILTNTAGTLTTNTDGSSFYNENAGSMIATNSAGSISSSSDGNLVSPTDAATSSNFITPLNSNPPTFNSGDTSTAPLAAPTDIRVRLMAIVGQETQIYGAQDSSNILSILWQTTGVLFPYTPQITFNQGVDYKSADLVHSNGDIFTYTRTPSVSLGISAKFTVQNQREGQYAIAVIHFLRTVSKMHFGENDKLAGLPPPVLLLRGYGNMMFNDLKVLVKSHSYTLDDNIDYVDVNSAGTIARVPSFFTLSIDLNVMQTPAVMRTQFNLDDFRTGKLMTTQTGWI